MEWLQLSPEEWVAVRLSIKVSIWATLVSLPLGILVALALARGRFWGKSLLNGIVHRDRLVIFGGGVPITVDGRLVGAVGCSGGSAEQVMEKVSSHKPKMRYQRFFPMSRYRSSIASP